jgi:hypothetical protein
MSSYTIIQDVTLELRRRIHAALVSAPGVDLGLTTAETDITLGLPKNTGTDATRLSLYLYHIEPDAHLRNQRPLDVGDTGLRFPPLALQLRYLITPLDEEENQNHLMLGRILQHFHDEAFVVSLNGVPLDNAHGGNSPQFRIMIEALSIEQLSQIWGALNADYRLSVAYTVRIVAIDSDRGITEANRVREAYTAVGLKA